MLKTEEISAGAAHFDKADTAEMLRIISAANRRSVEAVDEALPLIAPVVEAAAEAIIAGGRIIYVGAGTSGRLAMVDASECPPTFGTDPETVVTLMAGGKEAFFRAAEGMEDNAEAGQKAMEAMSPGPHDIAIGISASGGAEFVAAALKTAHARGAKTASISSNANTPISRHADFEIVTDTGAEVIAGSTRMKAGNAQKMVLNMISTCAMAKAGKIAGNLMVNLKPTNKKLRNRMIGITARLAGVDSSKAEAMLEAAGWDIRRAAQADSAARHST